MNVGGGIGVGGGGSIGVSVGGGDGGGVSGSVDAGNCVIDAGNSVIVGSASGVFSGVCGTGDCSGSSRAVWNNFRDDAAVDDVTAAV